jgi:O-antigen ligase
MNKANNLIESIFYILYLLVHFVPPFWGADVMGIQWLYLSVLDLFVIGYLFLNHTQFKPALFGIFKNKFVLVYLAYFIWALGSYFYAINGTEAIVCLARLVTTFILFINLSVLFYNKDMQKVFKQICFIITLVAILDFLIMAGIFFWFIRLMPYDGAILKLSGMSYGNKNITAASMLINIPFIIYYVNQSKFKGQVLGITSLIMAIFSLFILSTRSTLVGMFLILLIYTVYVLFIQKKSSFKLVVMRLSFFILPIIFVYFTSNLFVDYVLKSKQQPTAGYGKVSKRIGDISIEKGSDRLAFWKTGIDYSKKHLILGAGYGNWKIASLPYEKDGISEFVVRYHLHNDFIENFTDLGLIGGILYLTLFLLAFLFLLKIWFNKKYKQFAFATTISFMAITCYFVDASLNFPVERPVMQVMFAFSAAMLFSPISLISKKAADDNEEIIDKAKPMGLIKLFISALIVLLLSSIVINTQVYRSMFFQMKMMGDLGVKPVLKLDDVKNVPMIPNLSFNTLPLSPILARYYIRDRKFDEAYRLLNADKNANPSFHYNDYVMSQYFEALKNNDSAYYYAKQAFHNWPRVGIYFYNLMPLAIQNKDTAEMNNAFTSFINYRNDLTTWKLYLEGRIKLGSFFDVHSNNKLLDSAAKLFPNDSATFLKLRAR